MKGIARRQLAIAQHDFLRSFCRGLINRKHLVDHAKQSVKRRLDGIAPVNGDVAVQDLLKHLGIRNEALPVSHQSLQQSLGVSFVGMRRADEVHRDVGIHKNHECGPAPYPISISASMASISLEG